MAVGELLEVTEEKEKRKRKKWRAMGPSWPSESSWKTRESRTHSRVREHILE